MTVFIILYLLGMPVAYLLVKKDFTETFKNWTISDRRFSLFMALFSLVTVATYFLVKFFDLKNDKPVKW